MAHFREVISAGQVSGTIAAAAGSIGTAELADDAVTAAKLADDAVVDASVAAAAAIDGAKIDCNGSDVDTFHSQTQAGLAALSADAYTVTDNGSPTTDAVYVNAITGVYPLAGLNCNGGGTLVSGTDGAVLRVEDNSGSPEGAAVYEKAGVLVADFSSSGSADYYVSNTDGRLLKVAHDADPSTGGVALMMATGDDGLEGDRSSAGNVDVPVETTRALFWRSVTIS